MRLLALCVLLCATPAQAHVKWFVPLDEGLLPSIAPFSLTEPTVQLGVLLTLLAVIGSLLLSRHLPSPPLPRGLQQGVLILLPYGTGVSLLLSAWSGAVLAPHYSQADTANTPMLALAFVAGALLLFSPLVLAGALTLLVLYAGLLLQAGPTALEYLNLAAIAAFLALSQQGARGLDLAAATRWLPLLRIGTGLALVLLAFNEKLLRPDYGAGFVGHYLWNFMAGLGISSFDDRSFVLAAGLVEALLGTLLILGSTTRLCVLVISVFMLSSNLTFLLQGHVEEALTEITGHLPIICTALILLTFNQAQRQAWHSLAGSPSPAANPPTP